MNHGDRFEPTPPRPGSLDDAQARGFDTDSVNHDRVPVEVTAEMRALVAGSLLSIRHRRDNELADDHCGERCEKCWDRMCAVNGPEPRACATTCTDCPCSCPTCFKVREEMRADLQRHIEREGS